MSEEKFDRNEGVEPDDAPLGDLSAAEIDEQEDPDVTVDPYDPRIDWSKIEIRLPKKRDGL